jgi:D-glycero-D-manno-heptose 1,7-bisphosphate phosphatase
VSLPAILFDRDGVLNRAIVRNGKPCPPSSLAELEIMPEAESTLTVLAAHFVLVGITNQPDVARGTQSKAVVEAINKHLLAVLPMKGILVCFHDDADDCTCRKPKTGLLLQAADRYQIDLSQSFVVGDQWKDVEAGHRAGCRTVFIDYHYDEKYRGSPPDFVISSLAELGNTVLARS